MNQAYGNTTLHIVNQTNQRNAAMARNGEAALPPSPEDTRKGNWLAGGIGAWILVVGAFVLYSASKDRH